MFIAAKKFIYSACIILLFGVIIPVWIASVKAEAIQCSPASQLADPVAKVVGNMRRFLLGRVEGARLHHQMGLWSQDGVCPTGTYRGIAAIKMGEED